VLGVPIWMEPKLKLKFKKTFINPSDMAVPPFSMFTAALDGVFSCSFSFSFSSSFSFLSNDECKYEITAHN
jgi:hypothetical protein